MNYVFRYLLLEHRIREAEWVLVDGVWVNDRPIAERELRELKR